MGLFRYLWLIELISRLLNALRLALSDQSKLDEAEEHGEEPPPPGRVNVDDYVLNALREQDADPSSPIQFKV